MSADETPTTPAGHRAAGSLRRDDPVEDPEQTVVQPPLAVPSARVQGPGVHVAGDAAAEQTVVRRDAGYPGTTAAGPPAPDRGTAPRNGGATGDAPGRPAATGAPPPPWLREPDPAATVPVERYTAPAEALTPRRRARRPAAAAVGLVAVLAVGLLVWRPWSTRASLDPNAVVSPSRTLAPAPASQARSEDVVRDYLTSLARGDVAHAISLGHDHGTGAGDLLSPSLYAAARARAPITDVQVPRQPDDATTISASYRVGGRDVRTSFELERTPDLTWQLASSVARVSFSASGAPLQVSGHALRPGVTYDVLPGDYAVTTGQQLLTYAATDELHVDTTSVLLTPTPHLQWAPGAEQAVQDAVQKALQACAATHVAAPADCPFGYAPRQPGDRLVNVTWQLSPTDVRPVGVTLDPGHATGVATVRVDATMSADEVPGRGAARADAVTHVIEPTGALDCQSSVPLLDGRPDRLHPTFDPGRCVTGR